MTFPLIQNRKNEHISFVGKWQFGDLPVRCEGEHYYGACGLSRFLKILSKWTFKPLQAQHQICTIFLKKNLEIPKGPYVVRHVRIASFHCLNRICSSGLQGAPGIPQPPLQCSPTQLLQLFRAGKSFKRSCFSKLGMIVSLAGRRSNNGLIK